jgi:hypothetical protein
VLAEMGVETSSASALQLQEPAQLYDIEHVITHISGHKKLSNRAADKLLFTILCKDTNTVQQS